MKGGRIILAPGGFPWAAAAVWIAVAGSGALIGAKLFPSLTIGAAFTVSAMFANAAFAGMLGRN